MLFLPDTDRKMIFHKRLFFFLCLFISLLVWGCGRRQESAALSSSSVWDNPYTADMHSLITGDVTLTKSQLKKYGTIISCLLDEDKSTVQLTLSLPEIPASIDDQIYVFSFDMYENDHTFAKEPIASCMKAEDCMVSWKYQSGQIFQEFVPALKFKDGYVPVAAGSYITNPQVFAANQSPFPESDSKKGLLIDPATLNTPLLNDLGVKHAIYNIPLSTLYGETTNPLFPTIEYQYRDHIYTFNGEIISFYDVLFAHFKRDGMTCTAIILNDLNENYPEMIHPLSRGYDKAFYYAFNTEEEEGTLRLQATASFLTARYGGGESPFVTSWIIANEINQHRVWNYMDTDDIDYYASEFEEGLRIFYNAAKSNYANARVYFSVDHEWTSNEGDNSEFFNSRDLIEKIKDKAREKGNYDWGLALHPYPNLMANARFWKETAVSTQNSPTITPMNLRTVTDFLRQKDYLDTQGKVRHLIISELGFSSYQSEELQAAAFAYCYTIIKANPYIDVFFMNRQTDSPLELKDRLAFGIYTTDYREKPIKEVFQNIDTDKAGQYTDFMLKYIGASSLEEALYWAG